MSKLSDVVAPSRTLCKLVSYGEVHHTHPQDVRAYAGSICLSPRVAPDFEHSLRDEPVAHRCPDCGASYPVGLLHTCLKRDRFRDVAPDAVRTLGKAVQKLVETAHALAIGDLDNGDTNAASGLVRGAELLNVAADLRQLRDVFE
jgi:hypothetical protein